MPPEEGPPLLAYMQSISDVSAEPSALLVISAHWEARHPTVNTAPAPGMLYDYNGFPDEAYRLQWPAPGHPELAAEVRDLLRTAGFQPAEDAHRGYDHGTFVPLLAAYPDPTIPVVQLSLKLGLDPAEHLAMGRALAPLRDRGVYVIGSGNSFHNLRALFGRDPSAIRASASFDEWLTDTIALPAAERDARLVDWKSAPHAAMCHPREEHLIPLMVAAGAAGDDVGRVPWRGTMSGMHVAAHHFG